MTMTPERLAEIRARSAVRDEMLFWQNKDAHHEIKDLLAEVERLQQEAATVRREAVEMACRAVCHYCTRIEGGMPLHTQKSGGEMRFYHKWKDEILACNAHSIRKVFAEKGEPDAG